MPLRGADCKYLNAQEANIALAQCVLDDSEVARLVPVGGAGWHYVSVCDQAVAYPPSEGVLARFIARQIDKPDFE